MTICAGAHRLRSERSDLTDARVRTRIEAAVLDLLRGGGTRPLARSSLQPPKRGLRLWRSGLAAHKAGNWRMGLNDAHRVQA